MSEQLDALDDWELAEMAREQEVAYHATLSEIERRKLVRNIPTWDERAVASHLATRRQGAPPHWKLSTGDLPPALFRLGYEWAALTMIDVLEGAMIQPSKDAVQTQECTHVGNGLYRLTGKPRLFDPRRRGALVMLEELQSFFENQQRFMLFVPPPRRTTYGPDDDQAAIETLVAGKQPDQIDLGIPNV